MILRRAIVACLCTGVISGSSRGSPAGEKHQPRSEAVRVLAAAAHLTPVDGLPVKCGLPLLGYGWRHRTDPIARDAVQALAGRPVLQTSVRSAHFRIHFDTTGANTPALLDATHQFTLSGTALQYVDSVAASAEFVFRSEIDSLGYTAPPPDDTIGGGPEYDIYIVDLAGAGYPGVYGYTSPDDSMLADGQRSTTFVVIDNRFLFLNNVAERGIPALHVTLAHEFHHAVQIGSYAYWYSELYYHEITSVWMETRVYPAVTDYLQYVQASDGQFANPGTPFYDNGTIMYSRGIWGIFLAKRFDPVAMRLIWEGIRTTRPLVAIDNALRHQYSSSMESAIAEWELWNYFTGRRADSVLYYPAGGLYRLVTSESIMYSGSPRSVPGAVPPLAAHYFDISGGTRSLSLIAVNVDYPDALVGTSTAEAFSFDLAPTGPDPTYRGTLAGIFVKLSTANTSHWWSWDIANGIVGTQPVDETIPFPNPFIADGVSRVYFPTAELQGSLAIYSSSLRLVFQASVASIPRLGRRAFSWDGTTGDNRNAASGVYVYILSLENRTVKGKFVLVRK